MSENNVDRVMDSVDKVGEKVDNLVERVVAAVQELGPEAQWAFNDTITAYGLENLISMVAGFGICLVFFLTALYFRKGVKKYKEDKVDSDLVEMFAFGHFLSLILTAISLIVVFCHVSGWVTKWLHPVGSIILEKL